MTLTNNFNFDSFVPEINLGEFENIQIKFAKERYLLTVSNKKWMMYDPILKTSLKEFYSHYDIAYGNVVCTGLGLGIREQLLLTKSEITTLTVVEKSLNLIKFHQQFSDWAKNPKINFINMDAAHFNKPCDTLLLDHYEDQNMISILNNIKQLHNKIDCTVFWFWPLEKYILRMEDTLLVNYNNFKNMYGLSKCPNLTEEQLRLYCSTYHIRA